MFIPNLPNAYIISKFFILVYYYLTNWVYHLFRRTICGFFVDNQFPWYVYLTLKFQLGLKKDTHTIKRFPEMIKDNSHFQLFSYATMFLLVFILVPAMGLVQYFYFGDDTFETVHGPLYNISENWEYQWGNPENGLMPGAGWQPIKRPINPPQRNGEHVLWLRTRMPGAKLDTPTLLIDGKGVLLTFEAFLDDGMIYKFGEMTSSGQGNISGISSHLIPLGNDFQGRILSLRIFSDYRNIGIRGNVTLGSKSDLIQKIIRDDLNRFILGLLMILIGVLELILYNKSINGTGPISMFGILAVSLGIYMINVTAIKDLIFYAPVFWFNIYIIALALIPVGAMGFIWQTFRPIPGNLYHRLWQFHIVYAFIIQIIFFMILNSLLPMVMGSLMLTSLRMLFLFEMFLIVGVLVKDSITKKNWLVKIYLIGLVPIILSGVHDALVGLGKVESSYTFTPWALMFFILSQEIIKRRQSIRTQHRLKIYAQELEAKSQEKAELIKDLHDGLGGATTNIKFLSQMGLKDSSVEGMKKSLGNISALSSDCLIEIGSFMQSLDEDKTDWPTIVDNLYSTGKKMLNPLGISFEFRENIDPHVKKPTQRLFLNLLRIYKESLTNISKHAKATRVLIKLEVQMETILLSIQDNGLGFGDDVIKGRGIDNMKARAVKLGGKLTIDSDGGTCVILEIKS
jgi:signal transduction histidine kinase